MVYRDIEAISIDFWFVFDLFLVRVLATPASKANQKQTKSKTKNTAETSFGFGTISIWS